MEGKTHFLSTFLLLYVISLQTTNISVCFPSLLSFTLTQLLPLPLWQNTTALISWVSKCSSHSLLLWTPPPCSPPPQASPLMKHSRGGRKLETLQMKHLLFTQLNELPCGYRMVCSCQAVLPLWSRGRESENKHRRGKRGWGRSQTVGAPHFIVHRDV